MTSSLNSPIKVVLLCPKDSTIVAKRKLDARVYFYHHILHDWSDKMCLEILRHVKKAMKPGYSKLLLHEMIIPETGASNFHSMLDMTMMAFNGGMERTGRQWKELLDEAGFEILKIWVPPEDDADGIVEAMVTA
jgi:hypothetical protein